MSPLDSGAARKLGDESGREESGVIEMNHGEMVDLTDEAVFESDIEDLRAREGNVLSGELSEIEAREIDELLASFEEKEKEKEEEPLPSFNIPGIRIGDMEIPATPRDVPEILNMLGFISSGLEKTPVLRDEVPALERLLDQISESFPDNEEIKKKIDELTIYLLACKQAHRIGAQVPTLITDRVRTERDRANLLSRLNNLASNRRFEEAYELALESYLDDPDERFLRYAAAYAKLAERFYEAKSVLRRLPDSSAFHRFYQELDQKEKEVDAYRELIEQYEASGNFAKALRFANIARNRFPLTFEKDFERVEREAEYDKQKKKIGKRREEIEKEAEKDEKRRAEIEAQVQKNQEERERIEREAKEIEEEKRKLEEEELITKASKKEGPSEPPKEEAEKKPKEGEGEKKEGKKEGRKDVLVNAIHARIGDLDIEIPDEDSDLAKERFGELAQAVEKLEDPTREDELHLKELYENLETPAAQKRAKELYEELIRRRDKIIEARLAAIFPEEEDESVTEESTEEPKEAAPAETESEDFLEVKEEEKGPDLTPPDATTPAEETPEDAEGKLDEALHYETVMGPLVIGDEEELKELIDALKETGVQVESKKDFRKVAREVLREYLPEKGLKKPRGKFDPLNLKTLVELGVKSEDLHEIGRRITDKLEEKSREAAAEENGFGTSVGEVFGEQLAKVPTTPKPPAPEQEPVAAAEEKEIETAEPKTEEEKEGAKEQAEEVSEDIDKQVDAIFQALKDEREFKEFIRMIKALKTSSKNLDREGKRQHRDLLRRLFGTNKVKEVREKISEGDYDILKKILDLPVFMDNGNINKKLILKTLIETLDEAKTVDLARGAVADALLRMRELRVERKPAEVPEATKVPQVAESKAEEEEEPETVRTAPPPAPRAVAVEEAPAPQVEAPEAAPIAEEKKEEAPVEEKPAEEAEQPMEEEAPISERSELPDGLMEAIEKAAAGDEKAKEKLLDLWEVSKGKAKLDKAELTQDVKKLIQETLSHVEAGKEKFAVRWLKNLLKVTEGVGIRKLSEQEVGVLKLRRLLDNLSAQFPELRKRLNEIFGILSEDPKAFGEDAETIEDIQKGMRDLLLEDVAEALGMEQCSDLADFMAKFRALGGIKQKKGLKALAAFELLMKDEEVRGNIEDFQRITGVSLAEVEVAATKPAPKKKEESDDSGGTPPSTPPAAPGAPPAAPETPPTPPSAPPAPPAPQAAPDVDVQAPAPEATRAEAVGEQQKEPEKFSVGESFEKTKSFMESMGYSFGDQTPSVTAIRNVLLTQMQTQAQFDGLKAFLKRGEYFGDDTASKLAQQYEKAKLNEMLIAKASELSSVDHELYVAKLEHRRNPEKGPELMARIRELESQKITLHNEKADIESAIKIKSDMRKKETVHYRTPEQLLGMINLYFAKEMVGEDETPDYERVLESTNNQIAEAERERVGIAYRIVNEISFGILKPTLRGSLETIAEQDPALKKISADEMKKLAKVWNDQGGVDEWVRGLEGSEKEKMEKTIPAIIGHLEVAVNAGRMGRLNTFSLNRGKGLLMRLRKHIHEYSLEQAEKASGGSIDKMSAYFASLNQVNRKAKAVSVKTLHRRMYRTMGRNLGIGIGLGAGAHALAGLSALGLATAGVVGGAATAGVSSFRVEDKETAKALRKNSVRGLAGAGLGAAALGLTPWLAAPIGVAGLFAPEISKALYNRRKEIGSGAVTAGKKTGYISARVAWAGLGLGLSMGLFLANERYRKFFGLPF